jgi:signal transduction histidine kinase
VSTVQIHPMGGDRRPSELSRGTPWRLAGTAARFSGAVLAGGAIGAVAFWLLLAALLALVFSPVAGLGLPFLAVMIWLVRPLAWLERRRVRWVTGTPVAEAYRPLHGSLLARVRILLADAGTWRDLAWLAVQSVAGGLGLMFLLVLGIGLMGMAMPLIWALQPSGVVFNFGWPVWSMLRAVATVPPSAALVVVSWWACSRMSLGSARLSGWLLAPGEGARLRAQMEHLAETRAETVDARAAELRRIERDLHDGAQARLVSLAMSLGMAEEEIDRDPAAARQLVAEARASASIALSELRGLVRGIHPPVLTERGLRGAVEALALASAVPVEVDVQLDQRLPAPLESALYFVIAEALANVARHGDASWAFVRLWRDDGRLRLLVHDDGRGGADPAHGSGLRGIQQRLAAFDGSLTLTSPPGGPTELFAELPCRR